MTLEEIRDLIKTVCDSGIAELEVQRGDNRVWIKRTGATLTQEIVVPAAAPPMANPPAPFAQISRAGDGSKRRGHGFGSWPERRI